MNKQLTTYVVAEEMNDGRVGRSAALSHRAAQVSDPLLHKNPLKEVSGCI